MGESSSDCFWKQKLTTLLVPSPLQAKGVTYSPLASSSQISKKTIRSYLHWQGPTLGLVMALSFVAGTTMERHWNDRAKIKASEPCYLRGELCFTVSSRKGQDSQIHAW